MMSTVRRGVEILVNDGVDEFIKRFLDYRRKLPGPFYPLYPYMIYYDNSDIELIANEVYTIQKPQSVDIKYDGMFKDQYPPFIDKQDWETKNLGRKVYEFSDAVIIGAPKGVGHSPNRYRPPQEGTPATIHVGSRFIVPSAIGTKNPRKNQSIRHLNQILGTRGVIQHWPSGQQPDREFDTAYLLPSPYGQAYAAWQSDLFKLRAFEKYKEITGKDPQLIVTPGPSELVEKYLSLMGYPSKSYYTLKYETIRVQRLLVPSHRPRKGNGELQPSPSDRPWARDRILSNINTEERTSSNRMYVSRQDERRRRIANFEEIKPILEEYNFIEYNPGNHSLEDQIRTFSQANVFLGPHSSGMINSMFSSNATVIELLSKNHWRTSTVFIVANEMGFKYEICPCEPVTDSHHITRHQDIIVDPSMLRKVLEKTLYPSGSTESVT